MKTKKSKSPNAVKRLRQRLGFTQAEFAAAVGVDAISVSRWERSISNPSKLARRQIERLDKNA